MQAVIPRPPAPGAGRVFLKYAAVDAAVRAIAALDGRRFGDNTIRGAHFSELDFAHGRLE